MKLPVIKNGMEWIAVVSSIYAVIACVVLLVIGWHQAKLLELQIARCSEKSQSQDKPNNKTYDSPQTQSSISRNPNHRRNN